MCFRDGAIVFASSNGGAQGRTSLEEMLRKACRIEAASLQHAIRIMEMTSQPIDQILIQEKLIDAKTFTACLRRHTEGTVYKLMAWKEGDFSFDRSPPPAFAYPVALKVDDLLLEGARRADEWTLIQHKIPSFDIVFAPMIGNAEELTTRGMSDMDLKVFSLVDGRRTIQDIINTLNLGEFEVAKSIFILLSVNLVRRK